MNHPSDAPWNPDPQLLAAYFDGELEGRDDLAPLRDRLEAWVDAHPETRAEWIEHQRLKKLWLATTPAEPKPATWDETFKRIDVERRRPTMAPPSRRPWLTAGIVAASILLLTGLL